VLDRLDLDAERDLLGRGRERAHGRARVRAPVLRRGDAPGDAWREPWLERPARGGRQPLGGQPERPLEVVKPVERLGVVAVGGHDQRAAVAVARG
jgi:hypothetical protein